MKSIQNLVAAVLLALWMLVSLSITTACYTWLGAKAGRGVLFEMERALGGFTLYMDSGAWMSIRWAQVLLCFPVLLVLSIPAVWWLRRWYRP